MSKKTDSKKQLDRITETVKIAHDDIKSLLNAISKKDVTVTLKDMNDCVDKHFNDIANKIDEIKHSDKTTIHNDFLPECIEQLTTRVELIESDISRIDKHIQSLPIGKSQKKGKPKLLKFTCKACKLAFEAECKEKQISDDETVVYSNCPKCSTYCIIRP